MPFRSSDNSARPLLLSLLLLLGASSAATAVISYHNSSAAIRRDIIETELPLTSDTIYSEIQKDLIRPVLLSSTMARDTFLRDWVIAGEQDPSRMTRYLKEIMEHYGAFTAFFVSDRTHTYYQAKGVLKQVHPDVPRDGWYFRERELPDPYVIDVDNDMANGDRLTVFINYKVYDYDGRFIGATGVGLTVDAVVKLIDTYQQRYDRSIFFVDKLGRVALTGAAGGPLDAHAGQPLNELDGLHDLQAKLPRPQDGTYEYEARSNGHLLNVRFIPELDWYLFVDKDIEPSLREVRRALYLNALICLLVIVGVLGLVGLAIRRYQARISTLATTDSLTGLPNRRGFDLLANQALMEAQRDMGPLAALLIDLDYFKALNDTHGHLAGDEVLRGIAQLLQDTLRQSDITCRWGGEEFIVVLKDTDGATAQRIAEKIRAQIERRSFFQEGVSIHVTASIGIADGVAGDSLRQLIGRADQALYRAKQTGRNRVCAVLQAAPA